LIHWPYVAYCMLANQTFLYFSDLAKDAFVIESMAEADNNRVSKQQLEHPYGNVCVDAALHFIMVALCNRADHYIFAL